MARIALVLLVALTASRADAQPKQRAPSLVGTWRVVGCATSPQDPADCARGRITFEAARWTIALPCCTLTHAYTVASATSDAIAIASGDDGAASTIRFDATGTARWTPGGLGGRVRELAFVRDALSAAPHGP